MVPLATLMRVANINRECFLSDDYYSYPNNLRKTLQGGADLIIVRHNRDIVGYILYKEYDTHIESLRRALTKEARGKGYGLKLTKKLIKVAHQLGKDIYTYVSKTNLPSLNSNLKCGYRIEDISKDWVYIRYKVKKNAKDT